METINAALETFKDVPANRKIVVTGEVSEPPGSQGPIYRALGEQIAAIVSRAVFVGTTSNDTKQVRSEAGCRRML